MTAAQLLVFLPAAVLVALSPGANNLLAFANGARAGFGPAVRALGGRMAAFVLLAVLVSLGLGALMERSAVAFAILKWLGVGYLVWLGIAYWRAPVAEGAPPPAGRLARREFLTALANPKAYLLFAVFLPQFVVPGGGFAAQLMTLGALYIAIEASAAALWAACGTWMAGGLASAARRRTANRVSGALMLLAAALLARTARTA